MAVRRRIKVWILSLLVLVLLHFLLSYSLFLLSDTGIIANPETLNFSLFMFSVVSSGLKQLCRLVHSQDHSYHRHFIESCHHHGRILSKVPSRSKTRMVRHLNQQEAIKVDEELFNEYKFSVDQLMELAGLSVASTIASVYMSKKDSRVLIICGPGNNGGDGMVAARHLRHFGFNDVTLLSARQPSKDLFKNLIHQAEYNNVKISYDASSFQKEASMGLVVDALFGFSFKPPVRPEFEPLMAILTNAQSRKIPVVSVDIPSAWDVEKGPPDNKSLYFMPDTLVSLTAPKLCAKFFTGPNHYLGGRFVPKKLEAKYSMDLPPYPGIECIVRL